MRTRNEKILRMVGQKSYELIAEHFGISRNAVAGVIFRDRYPRATLVSSPHGKRNKIGTGYRTGKRAKCCIEKRPSTGRPRHIVREVVDCDGDRWLVSGPI